MLVHVIAAWPGSSLQACVLKRAHMPLASLPAPGKELACRLAALEAGLQFFYSCRVKGELSLEQWDRLVDEMLGRDRSMPCSPRCGYLCGLPTRERPQHVHILDTLDFWLYANYITTEKHTNLTKYVMRWSGDGLGGCRKVVGARLVCLGRVGGRRGHSFSSRCGGGRRSRNLHPVRRPTSDCGRPLRPEPAPPGQACSSLSAPTSVDVPLDSTSHAARQGLTWDLLNENLLKLIIYTHIP